MIIYGVFERQGDLLAVGVGGGRGLITLSGPKKGVYMVVLMSQYP